MLISRMTAGAETFSLPLAETKETAAAQNKAALTKADLERKFDTLWHGP
jgi:hypothetical protein